ncbi:MAG: hypothetical protein ABWY00_03640 [Dongiaceae bacterium]
MIAEALPNMSKMFVARAAQLAKIRSIGIDANAGKSIRGGNIKKAENIETRLMQVVIAKGIALLK